MTQLYYSLEYQHSAPARPGYIPELHLCGTPCPMGCYFKRWMLARCTLYKQWTYYLLQTGLICRWLAGSSFCACDSEKPKLLRIVSDSLTVQHSG